MPIVPSRRERVHSLVQQLRSERAADRDSAVAQLTLQGARALSPLRAFVENAPVEGRLAALEVLDRIDDRRALPPILSLATDASRRVAVRAMEVAGGHPDPRALATLSEILGSSTATRRRAASRALGRLHGAGVVEALAPLVDALVDEEGDTDVRLAVLDVILGIEPPLPRSTLRPLKRRLLETGDGAVAARAQELDGPRRRASGAGDLLSRLRRGEVGEDECRAVARSAREDGTPSLEDLSSVLDRAEGARAVRVLADLLGRVGGAAAIPALGRAVTRGADGSMVQASPGEALEARAALHTTLATLDSRVALHDLRDLIARRPRGLMPELLAAAGRVGNGSFVPVLARVATEDPRLVSSCAATYGAIARRGRLRRSSSALRQVRPEHRRALEAFLSSGRRGRR